MITRFNMLLNSHDTGQLLRLCWTSYILDEIILFLGVEWIIGYSPHWTFLHQKLDSSKLKEPAAWLPFTSLVHSFGQKVVDDKAEPQHLTGCSSLAGRRQHSSSILHDQRLIESMDTPHVYLRNSRRYSWLLIFAQVTLGCIFLRCRELLCRNSLNDQVSSALENFFWGSFFTQRTLGGLFCSSVFCFCFFFPELPGLLNRTISRHFPFGPTIFCFCCSLRVCGCVWVCACAWMNVCGCDTSILFFLFCVKIFFYRFSRVDHCLLYEYFSELYTVWMKCYLKKKNCCIP